MDLSFHVLWVLDNGLLQLLKGIGEDNGDVMVCNQYRNNVTIEWAWLSDVVQVALQFYFMLLCTLLFRANVYVFHVGWLFNIVLSNLRFLYPYYGAIPQFSIPLLKIKLVLDHSLDYTYILHYCVFNFWKLGHWTML